MIGVATGDMGVTKSGEPGPSYQRGMALLGKYVLIAEGARGSLAKDADPPLRARRGARAAENSASA